MLDKEKNTKKAEVAKSIAKNMICRSLLIILKNLY